MLVYSHQKRVSINPERLKTNKVSGRSLSEVVTDCDIWKYDAGQMVRKLNEAKEKRPRAPKAHIITCVRAIFEHLNKKKVITYFFVELNGNDEKVEEIILGNLTKNRNYKEEACIDRLLKYILKETPLFMFCYIVPTKTNAERNDKILDIGQRVKKIKEKENKGEEWEEEKQEKGREQK